MKIKDTKALATPRSPQCEYCGRVCFHPTERHHIVARGMGGGNRMDIPENLVDLGGAFDCRCHLYADYPRFSPKYITKGELFECVGRRLGRTAKQCQAKVYRLLRLDKRAKR